MPSNDIGWLTASDARKAIQAGALNSETLVGACLARIGHRETDLGAWTYLDPEQALEAARAADRMPSSGPLHGIPFAVKDIIDTFDMPTCCGTRIYEGRRPGADASCVALLRAAGAIVLGKTVTTELAYFHPGKTRNPHALDRTPGGSSSGTAAAVADGMVPFGFGTQTAASLIRPAAFCGVVGYKSTQGSFSLAGIKSFAHSLDSLGWMSRSVEDAALVFACLNGMPAFEPALGDTVPSIGLCRTPHWNQASPAQRDAVEQTAAKLEGFGAKVVEVTLPGGFDDLAETHKTVMAYEAAKAYAYERIMRAPLLSKSLRTLLQTGETCSYGAYRGAVEHVESCLRQLDAVFGACDFLLTPSAPGEAPLAKDGTGDPLFSRIWTVLGLPSITVPVGKGTLGLPLGVQLVAGPGRDLQLFSVAQWVEDRLGVSREMRPGEVGAG